MRRKKIMKKYDSYGEVLQDYIDNKITFDEYVEATCIVYVGRERFDYYDLAEHDLYIYLTDGKVAVIENFY